MASFENGYGHLASGLYIFFICNMGMLYIKLKTSKK